MKEEKKFIDNWHEFVTDKKMDKQRRIISEAREKGKLRYKDGQFLLKIEHNIRCCPKCGRSATETAFRVVEFRNNSGQMIPCGLARLCYDCEWKAIEERNKKESEKEKAESK